MKCRGVAATLVMTMSVLLFSSPGASADPGPWEGPETVDAEYTGSLLAVAANASGVFAVLGDDFLEVAHRAAGAGVAWSAPQPLPGSGSPLLDDGLVMPLPSGAAVVFATISSSQRAFMWRVSREGGPGRRRLLPFNTFTPEAVDRAADGRWLVAGRRGGSDGPARLAVRSSSGAWQVSQRIPLGLIDLVGAWFDGEGVPHVMVSSARTSPGSRPLSELTLRPDGSWSRPHQLAKALSGTPRVQANTDGDVTVAYSRWKTPSTRVTIVRTRPSGGAWSAPLRFRQTYPALAIDELGRTSIVRTGREVFTGRVSPEGVLMDGWQQLTSSTFDNDFLGGQNLSVGANGVAVVGVVGESTSTEDSTRVERYWRCLPGGECVEVGDFDLGPDGFGHRLASGPAGSVYALTSTAPPCEIDHELCGWWLPAPSATP